MLGLMLAREGSTCWCSRSMRTSLRDFRGDTLHPSTMEIMDELGLAEGARPRAHAPRIKPASLEDCYGRGPQPTEDALPIHHLYAPVGLPGL